MPFNMSAASKKDLTLETEIDFGALGKLKVKYRPNQIDKAKLKELARQERESEDGGRSLRIAYFLDLVAAWDATYADGVTIPLTPEALEAGYVTEDVSDAMLSNILVALSNEALVGEGKGTRIRKL